MSPRRAAVRPIAALILLLALFAAPARAEDLTPDQARAIALQASLRGDFRLAYDLARVLLERDPNDVPALLALARAAPALGRADQGIRAAARAFRHAPNRLQRFNAAFLRAGAENVAEHPLRSQFWLRRAASLAETERQEAAVAKSFRRVRAQSPMQLSLTFGVRPTSNANGGSSADAISYGGLVFGLPGESRALAGVEYSAGVRLRYLLDGDARHATRLTTSLYGRTYTLTREAQDLAPDAKGSDYAYTQFQLGLSHDRRVGRDGGLSIGLVGARTHYGGAPLMNSLAFSLDYFKPVSPVAKLKLTFGVERQWRLDQTLRSADIYTLGLGATRKFEAGGVLHGELTLAHTDSAAASIANDGVTLRLDYDFAKPVMGVQFGLNAAVGGRRFPTSVFTAGARLDHEYSLGVSAVLTEIQYFGFSPRFDVLLNRTESNDDLYDRNDLGLRVGLQSSF
ncbi:surface lipoprotein assembly modifier [Frigidibacter sp. ROC022]|uniref:surface lipoprotein assembly modifier n=1 Tax=Frigidibacter sp. ROC022 TaxID=2971796 RepID=UPI00215A5A10|nr:surface lipoprotein assembly modifier [Frigidibacter sp. ROC022]MCR8723038.1 surface lipoprotein assembly modifier [Frigidibacter sp. ROC022]